MAALGVIPALFAGAAAASIISKEMTKGAPSVKAPTAMPTSDDEQVKAARRRQIAEMQARSGRASTILSDDSNDNLLGG
jgi:hypothetical protein